MAELRPEFLLELKGGSFSGPRLRGRILPGGGDWVLLRRDGVAQLDIRLTLATDDDEMIYVSCEGIFDITPQDSGRAEEALAR